MISVIILQFPGWRFGVRSTEGTKDIHITLRGGGGGFNEEMGSEKLQFCLEVCKASVLWLGGSVLDCLIRDGVHIWRYLCHRAWVPWTLLLWVA